MLTSQLDKATDTEMVTALVIGLTAYTVSENNQFYEKFMKRFINKVTFLLQIVSSF